MNIYLIRLKIFIFIILMIILIWKIWQNNYSDFILKKMPISNLADIGTIF